MGHFYTNITVKQTDAEAVAQAIAALNRYAAIAPAVDGFVMVYDRESEKQDGTVVNFARQLSQDLNTTTLAVMNHDDDVLYYWLLECGQELDRYNSCPSYFELSDDPQGGNAAVLANAMGRPDVQDKIDEILHCDAGDVDDSPYGSEVDRHAELVRVLGLPNWAVGYGYNSLAKDEFPENFPTDETFYTEADGDT